MTTPSKSNPAYDLNGKHPADRVYTHQAISSRVYLKGELPPTKNQVAAVLHALADHTHNSHMLSEDVTALGTDRDHLGDRWAQTSGLGRYFHGLGTWLETYPKNTEQSGEAVTPLSAGDCRFCAESQMVPGELEWWQSSFVICGECGCKRCPKATFHEHACSGSNLPGQQGSSYGDVRCGLAGCACEPVADRNDAVRAENFRLLASGVTPAEALLASLEAED